MPRQPNPSDLPVPQLKALIEQLLTEPLSQLGSVSHVAVKPLTPYVNRTREERLVGARRPDYATRQSGSSVERLYNYAYAARANAFRQLHPTIRGYRANALVLLRSWTIETDAVSDHVAAMHELELRNHAIAFSLPPPRPRQSEFRRHTVSSVRAAPYPVPDPASASGSASTSAASNPQPADEFEDGDNTDSAPLRPEPAAQDPNIDPALQDLNIDPALQDLNMDPTVQDLNIDLSQFQAQPAQSYAPPAQPYPPPAQFYTSPAQSYEYPVQDYNNGENQEEEGGEFAGLVNYEAYYNDNGETSQQAPE